MLLDVDHGTYPYVTSSSTTAGGACAALGIGPRAIDAVVGLAKAYVTRVGLGPFPTELDDAMGERLRQRGAEFGATTGRPRRCGWLDIPALRLAIRLSGIEGLALTKLDVLAGLEAVKICIGYELGGRRLDEMPLDLDDLEAVRPIYEDHPGWIDTPTAGAGGPLLDSSLPKNARPVHRPGLGAGRDSGLGGVGRPGADRNHRAPQPVFRAVNEDGRIAWQWVAEGRQEWSQPFALKPWNHFGNGL